MRKFQSKLLLILLAVLIAVPANMGTEFSFAGATEEKYFSQMTQDEKTRVLNDLIAKKVVPNSIKVSGKTYSLSTYNWNNRGVITYGEISAVNAANATTNFPNLKDGEWRYLGYDMNGGLYGNDDFPPDYPSHPNPQTQTWLTQQQVTGNGVARSLIGGNNTINADGKYSSSDKLYTASVFLDKNPKWKTAGWTASKITEYFFFNAVFSDNGLTRGQFIGVKNIGSSDSPVLRYQTFSVEVTVKFEIPPEVPDPGLPTDPDPEEPVVPPPPPGPDVTVNASLGLPPVSYAGHPALAQDYSVFNVDGETWSAQQTYSEGLASNRFRAIGGPGTVRKIANTKAEVTFANPGHYSVELEVRPDGGERALDVKPIDVKPTPTIIHALSGTQKQNRKQVINLKVAKRPGSMLTEFWVKLEYLDKGETVTLHHKVAGGNTLVNSDSIKTRPIEKLPTSDTYYENCKLEFLLKNTEAANCRYTVYVKDSRGNSDQVTKDFAVSPDKPPEAAMVLDGAFIRKTNSNDAIITVEDVSITDGDQVERTWFYRAVKKDQIEEEKGPWMQIMTADPGYMDYSFGTGKKISFIKTGVGLFEVKLAAKDLWTEETLAEYVDESDRLAGEAVSTSEVINIAPVVGLKALKAKTAEINILTGGEAEYNRVMSNLANLEQELLQQGIAAHITVDKMVKAEIVPTNPAAQKLSEVFTPFGWWGHNTFWEDRNYSIDNEKLYKISATWVGEGYDAVPSEPYTIGAWDALTGNPVWSSVFTDATLPIRANDYTPLLIQDGNEDYLFFTSNKKTLVLTKDNGSILTVLDMEIGQNNFVEGDRIYTVKTDGIYAISTTSGQIRKIYSGSVLEGEAREFGGKVHFIAHNGSVMYRGLFDLSTETVSFERLPAQTYDPGLEHSHTVLGIDAEGKMIVLTVSKNLLSKSYKKEVRVYSQGNEMIFHSLPHSTTGAYAGGIAPVYNEAGVCNYVSFTWDKSGSTYDYVYARVFDINSGTDLTHYISKKNCSTGVSDGNKNPFLREINGQVYVSTGAEWVYVMNAGNGIYDERCKLFAFDPAAGTVREADINEVGIPFSTIEYGRQSDVFAVIQTGDNSPGLSNGSESHVISWHQPVQTVVNNHINKSFKAGSNINALIIYDETNPAESYTPAYLDSLSKKADAKNSKLILATRSDIEEGGLGDAILSLRNEDRNTLGISVPEGQTGTISKSYNLAPGATYYYEYEVKLAGGEAEDIISFSHETQAPLNTLFTESSYKTVKSYYEDFEDAKNVNPFFTMTNKEVHRYDSPISVPVVREGYYKGADLKYKRSSNGYVYDPAPGQTDITFIIPEGHKGFLSFDYYLQKTPENYTAERWYEVYIKIDGKLWANHCPVSKAGYYSHPDLLLPGTHTLEFFASDYGREGEMKAWLDTIRVDLVEEDISSLPQLPIKETLSIDERGGDFAKVRGMLEETPQIQSYGEVSNAIVIDGMPGVVPYTTITNSVAGREAFNFDIPEEKTAIYTRLPTSSGSTNDNVKYGMRVTRTGTIQDTWLYKRIPANNSQLPLICAGDEVLTARQLNEPQTFYISYLANRARGAFLGITSVMVDSGNSGWSNLGFFLTGSGTNKKFFLQKEAYDETELTFTLPEGNHIIRDFRLYYIKNGLKVYADEEPFSDSAALSKWMVGSTSAAIIKEPLPDEIEEDKGLVYKKGEKILYGLSYFDYEGDPSKKQYWKYTHTPFNDGPHPDAAVILNADDEPVDITGKVLGSPIDRFYTDGKYTVEHWQEDNTGRPVAPSGNREYDKLSNVVSLTFYIEGGGTAPWVESIKTIPAVVAEGDNFKLQVTVDDAEKDELRLTTEVFHEKELIYIHKKNGIKPDTTGKYPPVLTDALPEPAVTGKYEVVCTVRDLSGAGVGSYRFTVVSEGKITGRINHTDQWEQNRKKYNLHFFSEEYNTPVTYVDYSAMKPPRKRGTNVFWSGERFMLSADVGGNPLKVTAEIDGSPAFKTILSNTGKRNTQNEIIFSGELWDRNMINRWGRNKPQELKFLFTAEYSGGTVKTFEDRVIVDSNTDYWLLHRLW